MERMERMERMATFYCCSPHKSIYLPFISKTAITLAQALAKHF